MIVALHWKRHLMVHIAAAFVLLYVALPVCFLQRFFHWDLNSCAGLLLAPFIARVDRSRFSIRYLLPAGIAIGLGLLLPVKSVFFIAFVFSVLLLLECSIGKLSPAILFLLVLVSPVFRSFLSVLDFPMRLWLTERVAALLDTNGINAVAAGNQIQMDRFEFAVDPACAGLHMLVISLIICLFLLVQGQQGRRPGFGLISLAFAVAVVLNVLSNFFRILLLVMYKVMPGTVAHDAIGIVCLLLYVIIPLYFGLKSAVRRFGVADLGAELRPQVFSVRYLPVHLIVAVFLVLTASRLRSADTLVAPDRNVQLKGYTKTQLESGILKLENSSSLVYLKPAAFYIPGHDPKLCWTGSGYVFENIREEQMGAYRVYTALLQKGKDRIYAAWWFDNGVVKTVDQLAWRWQAAKEGDGFYLVNVNAASRKELQKQVLVLLNNKGYLK